MVARHILRGFESRRKVRRHLSPGARTKKRQSEFVITRGHESISIFLRYARNLRKCSRPRLDHFASWWVGKICLRLAPRHASKAVCLLQRKITGVVPVIFLCTLVRRAGLILMVAKLFCFVTSQNSKRHGTRLSCCTRSAPCASIFKEQSDYKNISTLGVQHASGGSNPT